MTVAAPPWVRALGSVVRRMPRGRYRLVSSLRASAPPFVAALAEDAGGALFECDLSDQIAREVCLTGCYEPPVTRLMQRRLRRAAAMVDAGANWGYFSLLAAAEVGRTGCVMSLEPDPRQFERLVKNLRLNAFTHVTAIPKAAAAETGSAVLAGYLEHAENRGVSRLSSQLGTEPRFEIECTTLDAVTAHLARVEVVKVDVEGAELEVLRGMRAGLAEHRYRAVLLELHPALLNDRAASPDACLGVLLDAGYCGWTVDQSPRTYRRASDPRVPTRELVLPLDVWPQQSWPHVLWLAPGEDLG